MPEEHNNELPSIEDIVGQTEELPSVEDFMMKENIQEETQVIDDAEGNPKIEVTDVVQAPEWAALVQMVNDVRRDIPQIPEIKNYDKELEAICEIIDQVKSEIPVVPEVRYYETELEELRNTLQEVKQSVPDIPRWVYETNDVPDFSWYVNVRKTFNEIGENFGIVRDSIQTVTQQVEDELNRLQEEKDVLQFETKTDFKEVHSRVSGLKDQIFGQLKEQSSIIWNLQKKLKENQKEFEIVISEKVESEVGEFIDVTNETVKRLEEKFKEKNESLGIRLDEGIESLETKISKIPKPKFYEEELNKIRKELKNFESLREIVEQIQVNQEKIEDLQENYLLTEPPDEPENIGTGQDPLTPMDQKFATLKDLAEHYRIFINRVQTQLSTMGGGGAGFIRDLDDVEFDEATGNNKLLIYDAARSKWVGIASTAFGTGGAVGAAGTWGVDSVGIHTTKSVGIATTSAKAGVSLYVVGDAEITGNISVAGTITYDDVTNIDSLGIITARQDVEVQRNLYVAGISTLGATNGIGTVTIGIGTTALLVDGDARIIGILTVGRGSVTIDGENNTVTTGIVTITNSQVILGDNVTINASATGINSAPNVLYVAKDGNDSNNGTSIDNAKLTIKAAAGIATTGTVIKVLAGNYAEDNPIQVPAFCAIVGDDQRTVTVVPNNATSDIFHVRKASKIANMTFSGHRAPAAAIAFPTADAAVNQGGGKWKGPYIQNCTSDTTTGTGARIDGNQAPLLKSMNFDSFTQYNQGGVGIAVTNEGYAQLVSIFTICCNEAITCDAGGQADVANSNCSFGTYGLVSRGVGIRTFTSAVAAATTTANQNQIAISGLGTARPYDGQGVYFDQLYQTITSITLTNAGTGYTATPNVIIDLPSGPSGSAATAFATLDGDRIDTITLVSGGNQFASAPTITIDAPTSGTQATATADMEPIYYTVASSTPTISGISTLTLEENLNNVVSSGTTAYFHQLSRVVASSHTFEYIGSGNIIQSATPKRGGVTIQANEVFTDNGGRVVYTSTDQAGNFRIGDNLQINQSTGTISGRAFTRSLFSEMTPFILALS
jgi:uncharacterized coiled-coil DUF342 family protein